MKLPNRRIRAGILGAVLTTTASSLVYLADAHEGPPPIVSIPKLTSEVPVSVSKADAQRPVITTRTIAKRPVNGIPLAALSAYESAARVVNDVSPCRLDWSLLAAIGSVESDHGRYGGNSLSADGHSKPGIYGPALDGSAGTAVIADTDLGKLDKDKEFDRAVGPMQFIPTTWDSVGVDADGDRREDPQDIDDAALAASIYLCAGSRDLSSPASMRSAVLRYNHSSSYADTVLRLQRDYAASVPVGLGDNPYAQPAMLSDALARPDSSPSVDPATKKKASSSATKKPAASEPAKQTKPKPAPKPSVQAPAEPRPEADDPVAAPLTPIQEATAFCQAELTAAQRNAVGGLTSCVNAFVKGGVAGVQGLLSSLTGTLTKLLGG